MHASRCLASPHLISPCLATLALPATLQSTGTLQAYSWPDVGASLFSVGFICCLRMSCRHRGKTLEIISSRVSQYIYLHEVRSRLALPAISLTHASEATTSILSCKGNQGSSRLPHPAIEPDSSLRNVPYAAMWRPPINFVTLHCKLI